MSLDTGKKTAKKQPETKKDIAGQWLIFTGEIN
jgi:hypothetical protein